MKVSIFNGSPRKNGNTAAMTSCLKEKIKAAGGEPEEHFLYHMNVKGCMNCGACRSSGKTGCAMKDDASAMIEEFASSDLIILASPIYMWHLTASMNAFIERLHSLCNHEIGVNRMKGKSIALAVTMGDDEYVAADAVNSLLLFCNYFEMEYAGAFALPFASRDQMMRPLYQEKMSDFAKQIMKRVTQ